MTEVTDMFKYTTKNKANIIEVEYKNIYIIYDIVESGDDTLTDVSFLLNSDSTLSCEKAEIIDDDSDNSLANSDFILSPKVKSKDSKKHLESVSKIILRQSRDYFIDILWHKMLKLSKPASGKSYYAMEFNVLHMENMIKKLSKKGYEKKIDTNLAPTNYRDIHSEKYYRWAFKECFKLLIDTKLRHQKLQEERNKSKVLGWFGETLLKLNQVDCLVDSMVKNTQKHLLCKDSSFDNGLDGFMLDTYEEKGKEEGCFLELEHKREISNKSLFEKDAEEEKSKHIKNIRELLSEAVATMRSTIIYRSSRLDLSASVKSAKKDPNSILFHKYSNSTFHTLTPSLNLSDSLEYYTTSTF